MVICMRSDNNRMNGWYGECQRKPGSCHLNPCGRKKPNELSIDEITIKIANKMGDIFKNKGEHHVLIKDNGTEVFMEYIVKGKCLYKVRRNVGNNRDSKFSKISIWNKGAPCSFMIINELKLYIEKAE